MSEFENHTSKRAIGDVSLAAGRAATQMGWYRFAAENFASGNDVLDVGCGLGEGLKELRRKAKTAQGQEIDENLNGEGIIIGKIEQIKDKSFDVVISIDVVEHVPDDRNFVINLARIARKTLFLTTPLSALGREIWPYHIREYRPKELIDLVSDLGNVMYYKGTPSGSEIYPLKNMDFFWITDRLINNSITNIPFRAVQKLLPKKLRYNAHHAVKIDLA